MVVKEIIRNTNASIFCLQETKLNTIPLNKFYSFAPPHYHQYASRDAIGSRGGTIIAWQPTFSPKHNYTLTYSTTVVLTNNLSFEFMITNVYGPTDNACKPDFLPEIRIISYMHDIPWILMGDFNILRDANDTTSTNPNLYL
jgi:exonuclease III